MIQVLVAWQEVTKTLNKTGALHTTVQLDEFERVGLYEDIGKDKYEDSVKSEPRRDGRYEGNSEKVGKIEESLYDSAYYKTSTDLHTSVVVPAVCRNVFRLEDEE